MNVVPTDAKLTLMVDDSTSDVDSTVAMSKSQLESLGLFAGDYVLLKGKKRKFTVGTVVADTAVAEGKIKLSKVTRSNLR